MVTSQEVRKLILDYQRSEEAALRRQEAWGRLRLALRPSGRTLRRLAAALPVAAAAFWVLTHWDGPRPSAADPAPPAGPAALAAPPDLPVGTYDTH